MVFEEELREFLDINQIEVFSLAKNVQNLNYRSEYYKIKKYLDDFLNNKKGARNFIVMPGLRGVGKTTILLQLYDYLLNQKIDPNNLLFLSMDEIVRKFNIDLLSVVDIFLELIHKTNKVHLDKKIFIFVDESQYDKNWGLSGKIIYDKTKNIFLICTGSSAIDLEMNSDVARRVTKEVIYPNSFKDYLLLKHNIKTDYSFSQSLENTIYFGEDKYLNEAISLEESVYSQLKKLNNYPKIEFNEFLKTYGFPSTINSNQTNPYKDISSIINKIVYTDIPSIKSFTLSTSDNIMRILTYLALKRPGSLSNQKIANYLSISPRIVNEILGILEKTQIIFSVKPYAGVGKTVRSSWQYYFLSPTLKATINYGMGRYYLDNKKCLGALAENLVASSLFKMTKTNFEYMGLFYPTEKKGTDFLLRTKLEELVPVEVGIGKKTKSQLVKTIHKYDCEYGVLISNRYNRIKKENNIIHIPLMSFGFI